MVWFKRKDDKLRDSEKKSIPDGLWDKCTSCSEILYKPELEKTYHVCRHCGHHFRISPDLYLELLLDPNSYEELFPNVKSVDSLAFKAMKKYRDQLKMAQEKTRKNDAIHCYLGELNKYPIVLGIMDFRFIGGSFGSVVGEKVSRSIKLAGKQKCPFILICASGGARMQESALSLMQMAKTSSQLAKFSEEKG